MSSAVIDAAVRRLEGSVAKGVLPQDLRSLLVPPSDTSEDAAGPHAEATRLAVFRRCVRLIEDEELTGRLSNEAIAMLMAGADTMSPSALVAVCEDVLAAVKQEDYAGRALPVMARCITEVATW